jgi:hypothetical protein
MDGIRAFADEAASRAQKVHPSNLSTKHQGTPTRDEAMFDQRGND